MIARDLVAAAVAAGVSVIGASAWQAVKWDPKRAAAMHDNFRAAGIIQSALVRGDLEAMRGAARGLAAFDVPAGLPDGMTKHVRTINAAATQAMNARDVTVAATAAATMWSTCGDCHRAAGTMPAIAAADLPSVGGTVGHMLEHQRAIDQLLRGLVIPSNTEWLNGARALRAAPLHARQLPKGVKMAPELLRIEEAVHRLAEEAVAAEFTHTRSRVYGTLLARCADCHGLHRKIWGPPSP
jgi:hypothetical protein